MEGLFLKLSQLFFFTRKEATAESYLLSHQLLERAGYIKKLSRGSFHYMPLMCRVIDKLKRLIDREMHRACAQEVQMPCSQPASLWKASGRWDDYIDQELLYSFTDRDGQEHCMGPTHEEAVVHLITNQLTSYKQLPALLYQVNTKFRDEIRPRFGLMRAKEFTMKDAYSFSESAASLSESYDAMRKAYCAIFDQLELEYMVVSADGGSISKGKSEEFQVISDVGEDELYTTSQGAFNIEALSSIPPKSHDIDDATAQVLSLELHEKKLNVNATTNSSYSLTVATPDTKDIASLSCFLSEKISNKLAFQDQTVKTMIYKATFSELEEFFGVVIRGDRCVSEIKLKNHLNAVSLELASAEEVERIIGTKIGYVGPELPISTLFDKSVENLRNFTAACNQEGAHQILANWGIDFKKPDVFYDLLLGAEGDKCPQTGEILVQKRGIEVGHIFELGQRYSKALDATFLDKNGKKQPFFMGCYGIGMTRLIAAAVEQKSTSEGIIWPKLLAPYQVLVTAVTTKDQEQVEGATEIYDNLIEWGCEALIDDRNERLGFKMKDAKLIGIPIRLIIGKSWVQSRHIEVEGIDGCESITKEELYSLVESQFAI